MRSSFNSLEDRTSLDASWLCRVGRSLPCWQVDKPDQWFETTELSWDRIVSCRLWRSDFFRGSRCSFKCHAAHSNFARLAQAWAQACIGSTVLLKFLPIPKCWIGATSFRKHQDAKVDPRIDKWTETVYRKVTSDTGRFIFPAVERYVLVHMALPHDSFYFSQDRKVIDSISSLCSSQVRDYCPVSATILNCSRKTGRHAIKRDHCED